MENSEKNVDVLPEIKMPLLQPSYTERIDVTETENWPQDILDIARTETKIKYELILQDDADSVETLNSKELEELQICEDNSTLTEEKVTTVGSDETHREGETSIALMKMLVNKMCKKISFKKNKKNSQSPIDDKKEDLKKIVNHGKIIKQKATRKSNKTMLLPANLDQTHRRIDKGLKKFNVKSELHKTQTGRCLRNTISPLAAYVQSNDTNSTFNTNISCHRIKEEQVLHQRYMMNASQHLYYNDVKYSDQEIMSNSNPWLMAPMCTQNTILSDNIPNMQTENHFIDNAQYSTSIDGNWKQDSEQDWKQDSEQDWKQDSEQDENPCMSNHSIDFTESYDPFNSEGQACYNVYDLSYTGDDKYSDPRNFSNIRFQQVPTDITLNFITSTDASNNSLNATSGLFNDFQYDRPLQTDGYFNKLYYINPEISPMADYADNSESEMMIQENVMLPQNGDMPIWHHVNDITAYNNHLNIPLDAPVPSWSNVLPSYPLYTDNNIDASINTSIQLDDLYRRDTYPLYTDNNIDASINTSLQLDDLYRRDTYPLYTDNNIDASINTSLQLDDLYRRDAIIKINLVGQQLNTEQRENFLNPYIECVFEDTSPAIDMRTLNPYEDDELTNTLSHESYTPNSVEDGIISDITNPFSETDSAEASNLI